MREVLHPGNHEPRSEVVAALNRLLRGWADYFGYGTRLMAYRAIDNYVLERVRHFLRRRHKVHARGALRFSDQVVFDELGVQRLRPLLWTRSVRPDVRTSRRAGCGKTARPVL